MSRKKKKAKSSPTKNIRNCPEGQGFVFMMPDGGEVGRAKNIVEFIRQVKCVPIESLLYHTARKHFVPWLELIGEKTVAKRVSEVSGNGDKIRLEIIRCV
ncbi:MAG: hypothetical protein ABIG39_05320 [Candidatus Micrarchaeota archaeon]